jgi:hypothetical protein
MEIVKNTYNFTFANKKGKYLWAKCEKCNCRVLCKGIVFSSPIIGYHYLIKGCGGCLTKERCSNSVILCA